MPEASTIEPQGTLFIVATPIGNLSDITQRAIDTLATVDKVCAEDTGLKGVSILFKMSN